MSHEVTEAAPPARWRLRKASVTTQFESNDLTIRRVRGVNPSLRAGGEEMQCPSSINEARMRWCISPFSVFLF